MSGTLASTPSTLYTTLIPTAHATTAVVLETPPSPPLFALLPYLKPGIAVLQAAFKASLAALYRPIPAVLYLLSPFTTFLYYLLAVLFFIPYTYGVYVAAEIIHPIYVFCGVACLTGVLLGLVGRSLSTLLVSNILSSSINTDPDVDELLEGNTRVRRKRTREGTEQAEAEAKEDEEPYSSDTSYISGRSRSLSSSSTSSLQQSKQES